MAASTFTKPKVPIGAKAGVDPKFKKIIKSAPGTHTNNDTADDVPTDLCGGSEQAFNTGTVKVPPPMPSIHEKKAMQKDMML